MDAETISKDNCCELGKWLYGEAKVKFGKLSSHTNCIAKHKAFHIEAGKVAKTINAKKFQEAETMINSGTPYALASSGVGVAVMAFRKEAAI
jgi:methyl-accepting chemotaxis protein